MSTDVDGATPSVAPGPDDGNPDDGDTDRQPSGLDDGSQWVRAEIRRRMAENRSTRGRHARRGDATTERSDAADEDDRVARRAPTPPSPVRRVPAVPAVPPTPPGGVAAGDLPENYVPRHSVLTPGPAADPAPPISGPIPVVRPEAADDPAADVPAAIETRSSPVGGPSLPPTGLPLPVRKRRRGPGTPLQGGGTGTGSWARPGGSIVPSEPVQRLGAPPRVQGRPEPLPSWGVPSSPRGFAVTPAEVAPDPVADTEETAAEPVVGAVDTPVTAAPPAEERPAVDDAVETDETDTDALGTDVPAPAPVDETAVAEADPAEATTTTLPVIGGTGTPPPARMVGIPVQRTPTPTRVVPPRPVTPRHIPVVGTAPPEPGSTRVRVVLSERKAVARPVRTIKEVQEGTAVGGLLRRDLIRSQLTVTLRFAALTVFVLGALPAVLALMPEIGRFELLGVRLPWLLLGLLMYPFLVGVAWRYTRVADRVEQNFADHVQD